MSQEAQETKPDVVEAPKDNTPVLPWEPTQHGIPVKSFTGYEVNFSGWVRQDKLKFDHELAHGHVSSDISFARGHARVASSANADPDVEIAGAGHSHDEADEDADADADEDVDVDVDVDVDDVEDDDDDDDDDEDHHDHVPSSST